MIEYRNVTAVMKKPGKRKLKRRSGRGLINLIPLVCGFMIMVLMLGFSYGAFPFIERLMPITQSRLQGSRQTAGDNLKITGAENTAATQAAADNLEAQDTADTENPAAIRAMADGLGTKNPAAQTTAAEAAECLILVNRWNPIPEDYRVSLTKLKNGQTVAEEIYPALQAMFDAAREEGVYPVVASGYRTAEYQQRLMEEKIADYQAAGYPAEEARVEAEAWVALPGTSEHQLGIAVDINGEKFRSSDEEVYQWLAGNSCRFGFICRYPADKTEITGINDEPWHYRYVGSEAAAEMYRQGLCLEEYLGRVNG